MTTRGDGRECPGHVAVRLLGPGHALPTLDRPSNAPHRDLPSLSSTGGASFRTIRRLHRTRAPRINSHTHTRGATRARKRPFDPVRREGEPLRGRTRINRREGANRERTDRSRPLGATTSLSLSLSCSLARSLRGRMNPSTAESKIRAYCTLVRDVASADQFHSIARDAFKTKDPPMKLRSPSSPTPATPPPRVRSPGSFSRSERVPIGRARGRKSARRRRQRRECLRLSRGVFWAYLRAMCAINYIRLLIPS
jgi:hypothetical protein